MKKKYTLKIRLFIVLALFTICSGAFAQVSAYSFTSSAGTYAPITGTNLFATGWDDNQTTAAGALNLGFNFTFNGIVYTQIRVSSNGFIAFAGNPNTTNYTPVSGTTAYPGCISAFGRDLISTGATLQYTMLGAAPNRVFVVQWVNCSRYNLGVIPGDAFNFQIRLSETTNAIDVVYGSCAATNVTALTCEVGLRGASNADFNNRNVTTDWSASIAGVANNATCTSSNTVLPVSGQTYTWLPPSGCTGMPVAGTAVATPSSVGIGQSFSVSLSGSSSASGLTYQWQSSPDNITFTNIAGATTISYTTTETSPTYYQCIVTCTASGLSATSASVLVSLSSDIFMSTGSASVCSGTFYDSGGPGNPYSINEDYTLTLYPSTPGAALQVVFSSFAVETCCDNLTIYNGNTTGAPLIGTYTASPGTVLSTAVDGSLTFVFHSDFSVTAAGWNAIVSCISACSGTPVAGTTSSSANPVCSGTGFTLSLTGASVAGGLTYQWQSSPDNVTYTNIAGATGSTYAATQTTATYYQCIITCTSSGMSATSTPVQVTMNPFTNCYCTSSATSTADEEILNVTIGTLNNTSTCATTGGPGSVLSMYSNYTAVPAPTLTQSTTYPFSVQVGTCGGSFTNSTRIFIDFNQNGLFTDPGEDVFISTASVGPHVESGNITIPAAAVLGNTRMRVITVETGTPTSISACGTYTWGETEDYLVNISVSTNCSGTPSPGVTQSTAPGVCSGTSFTLSISTPPSGLSGITYQWQSSPDGVTYTNIAGATSFSYSTTQTADTYYQCVVTCTNSGLSGTSTPLQVTMNSFVNCYCTSSATSTADEEIFNVTVGTLNNTSTCATTGGPGSVLSMYSDYTTVAAAPTLAQSATYPFSVQVGTCGGSFTNSTRIFIDYNHNGLFTDAGENVYTSAAGIAGPHFETGSFIIPPASLPGNTRMRVITVETGTPTSITPCGTYAWGETEDYLVNIVPLPPNPPTPVQDPTAPTCSGGTNLTVPGSPAAGDAWYWQTTAMATSTATVVSGPYTVFLNGTYYVRTYNAANNIWSLGSDSVTVSNIPVAAMPPAPTAAASPACLNTTISMMAPATGIGYFWQGTNSTGASNAQSAVTPYTVNATGTYYVAAYDSTTSCWSNTNNVAVAIDTYVPAAPMTLMDSVIICQGIPSAQVGATPPPSSGSVTVSFGNALQSTGTVAATFTTTVPALPAGATITGTQLMIFGARALGGSYRSEIRVALSGATTLAPTQISTLASSGLITPDPSLTIPNLPVSGGAVTLSITETFDDGGTDASFDSIKIMVTYTLPASTINWWNAVTAGAVEGSGSPFETVGSTLLPNSNTPGTYKFFAASTSGSCSSSRVGVDVVINPLPTMVLSDTAVCSGTAYVLNAQNSGSTYAWNTSATTQTVSTSTGGLYFVDITTVNGCASRDSMNLVINSLPIVNLGGDVAFCTGDSILLDAGNSGFNFMWNDSTTNETLTTNAGGNYIVVVTNPATTCAASDSIMVTVNPLPIVHLGADTSICTGDSLVLNAGNAGATYAWNDASASQTLTVNSASTYFVFVTDPVTSCYKSDTISVALNALPVVTIGADTAICSGNSLMLDAGHPGSTYMWNDSSGAQTLTVNAAGNYSVLIVDPNGCRGMDSINVAINALPIVNLGTDTAQCAGTVMLDAGNTGSSFVWNDASVSQTLVANTTGTYAVAVTNINGCTAADSVNVTINALPVVNLGSDTIQCGGSVVLDAGNPGLNHLWYDSSTGQTLTVYSSNTISVLVTNPATGCMSMDTVNVTFNQYPIVNLGNDITQCAGSVMLDAGNTGAGFAWNTSASSGTINVTTTGTYMVAVTNGGCTAADTVNVTINPLPNVGFPAVAAICLQGGAITMNATPAGGTFTGGAGVSGSSFDPMLSGVGSHPVLYTVTDANSCSNSTTQNINVNDCTGIEENAEFGEVTIYPNPTSSMFNIEVLNANFKELTINITDLQGKEVYNFTDKNIVVDYNKQIDLEGLAKGIYYVRLTTGNGSKVQKLVIQ